MSLKVQESKSDELRTFELGPLRGLHNAGIPTDLSGPIATPSADILLLPWSVVVIQDHIALPNLTGMNPLLGPPVGPEYPRFLPLSAAYSASLRRLAFLAAHELHLGLDALAEGVYAWVSGPTYETPAEGRMLRNAGADVVGMSTIPEVLAGKEEGLEVLVLSLVTNMVVIPDKYRSIREEVEAEVGASRPSIHSCLSSLLRGQLAGKAVARRAEEVVSHEEVLLIGKQKAEVMKSLVEKIVDLIARAA